MVRLDSSHLSQPDNEEELENCGNERRRCHQMWKQNVFLDLHSMSLGNDKQECEVVTMRTIGRCHGVVVWWLWKAAVK